MNKKTIIFSAVSGFIALAVATYLIITMNRTIQNQDRHVRELYKLVNIQEEVINASQEVILLQEKIISMD